MLIYTQKMRKEIDMEHFIFGLFVGIFFVYQLFAFRAVIKKVCPQPERNTGSRPRLPLPGGTPSPSLRWPASCGGC